MIDDDLPAIIQISEVHREMLRNAHRKTLVRYLDSLGILIRNEGSRPVVDVQLLREKVPQVWRKLYEKRKRTRVSTSTGQTAKGKIGH